MAPVWVLALAAGLLLGSTDGRGDAPASGNSRKADTWWDTAWTYRLAVRANFGMVELENPLITARISRDVLAHTVPDVDTDSFRLIDAQSAEVPCAVRTDAAGDSFVAWRIQGRTGILDVRKYHVYLDSKTNGRKPARTCESLADVPPVVPGMNLISGGAFAEADSQGFPKDWDNIVVDSGVKSEWTEADKASVQALSVDARNCLRLANGRSVVQAIRGLKEGLAYRFSLLGKVDPGATILVTVVFRRANLDWFRNGTGNYKMQSSLSMPGNWVPLEMSTFVYADKDGNPHCNNTDLLPETETAYVIVSSYQPPAGAVVHVTDVRFELAGYTNEMKVVVGGIERSGPGP
jgi:hypothetical protein